MSLSHENQVYRYAEAKRRREMPQDPTPKATNTCDHEHDVKKDMSFMLFADNIAQERRENGIYD